MTKSILNFIHFKNHILCQFRLKIGQQRLKRFKIKFPSSFLVDPDLLKLLRQKCLSNQPEKNDRYFITKKFALRGYILGVLMHTTAKNGEIMKNLIEF